MGLFSVLSRRRGAACPRIQLSAAQSLKRSFDISAAAFGVVATAPLALIVALAVKLESDGPILFAQERLGKGQKPFRIIKFRTMVRGADGKGPAITVHRDERITRIGRVLRRLHLDELPNLLNVLKGDMSLVGPRPELPRYLRFYTEEQKRVFDVRPGLTDLGTLKFRDEAKLLEKAEEPETFYVEHILPEKLRWNLDYVERQDFFYDLGILLKTGAVVCGVFLWDRKLRRPVGSSL